MLTPELSSGNWRFYFIGKCKKCEWVAKASDIPKLYQDFSFDTFNCKPHNLENIVKLTKSYAQDPKGFLLIQGGYGTGKTHLAVSILRETSLSFNYVSHLNLIQEYRNFHYTRSKPTDGEDVLDTKTHLYEKLRHSSLLCIDEFGFVHHSHDVALITFNILDYRFQELLPTILLTNHTTDELKEIIDSRLMDRIEQALYANLQLGFKSKRKSMNSQYLKKAKKLLDKPY